MEDDDDSTPSVTATGEAGPPPPPHVPLLQQPEPLHDSHSFPSHIFPEIVVFRDEEDEEEDEEVAVANASLRPQNISHGAANLDSGGGAGGSANASEIQEPLGIDDQVRNHLPTPYIDPEPHISSQFYTFNRDSHALMARCILESRLATPDEIRHATPRAVLRSWRSVWKDRNEDTAYLTAWKRIQDKLNARVDPAHGQHLLYFKNNSSQYVSHVEQWQDIVTSFHGDADLRHLGLKDTIDRIKQVWTVGAKFYGIPESFIRVCVASCPVCTGAGQPNGVGGGGSSRNKRRRFEYTESFDVPARDVPHRLQQLAAKHKVVLCIRQKYIRYKPFMAEVKDYACHRAGEPSSSAASKRSRVLKREPYASKRCGCGFRIRAIVPIANYNEKDKTFVYQEEGTAVFKLYAVHTGHEPGPMDGNARVIHRIVGHKGVFEQDPVVYGVNDDIESESYISLLGKDDRNDLHLSVLQQVHELRNEAGILEGKVISMPQELLGPLSQELSDILHRIRSMHESMLLGKPQQSEEAMVVGNGELGHWEDQHEDGHESLYDKDVELIEDEETDFDRTLRDAMPWDRMRSDCQSRKMLMTESCKPDKWMIKECGEFDEKSILDCGEVEEDLKLIKPIRHDRTIGTDSTLVGIHMDGFYSDNAKWYDSPSDLDPGADTGDGGFRHEGIV